MNSTFHWVEDQPLEVKEFTRVLKPRGGGGRLGILDGSGDYLTALQRIKANMMSRELFRLDPEKKPAKFIKRHELKNLLDTAGLSKCLFIVISEVGTCLSGKALHCIYLPAPPLFRQLYHIKNHKVYALLEVVTPP